MCGLLVFIVILFIFVPYLYHEWYKVENSIGYRGHLYVILQRFTPFDINRTDRQPCGGLRPKL